MGQQAVNLPEFEEARKRFLQRSRAARQEQEQAIKRQFARTGMIGSGAAIKTLAKSGEEFRRAEEEGLQQIGAGERAEQRRLKEIEAGRQFSREEAEKQRAFARAEAGRGREFALREAERQRAFGEEQTRVAREFAARESSLGRLFTKEQNALARGLTISQAEKQRDFSRGLFEEEQALKKLQADRAYQNQLVQIDLQKQALALEKDAQAFNKEIARAEANRPTDLLGSLLGPAFSTSGGPLGGILNIATSPLKIAGGAIGSIFCHVAGTLVAMKDGTYKLIEDLRLGDELIGGKINHIGMAIADAPIYKYKDEYCTKNHVVFEDNKFRFIQNVEGATLTDKSKNTVVYPLDTEKGFYITKSGVVSSGFMRIEGSYNPAMELELLNLDFAHINEIIKEQGKMNKLYRRAS
jgi:hypothetical protein